MSTSILAVPTFPTLTFTSNNLADVIRFVKEKNVLVLHTEGACRVFHMVPTVESDKPASLSNVRVIYLDCNGHKGLLEEGEWNFYINAVEGVHEVGVSALRNAIIAQREVPNKVYISLGYKGIGQ